MIDPSTVALFIPPNLKEFKLSLFERVGQKIVNAGGRIIRHDYDAVDALSDDLIPIVGCTPRFRNLVLDEWPKRNRKFIFWDRGYLRRFFVTWLPRGHDGGYYRWTVNSFQMKEVSDVPNDRWKKLKYDTQIRPWNKTGQHIIVAASGGTDYDDLFSDREWTERTVEQLRKLTTRPVRVREKETRVPLYDDLRMAHAMVTHGSIAAIESVIMGCPVFVHPFSAARFVGLTDISRINNPVYPDRQNWLYSLAYNQFNEQELVDGTLWRLLG